MKNYLWNCYGMFPTLWMRKRESNIFSVGYHITTKIESSFINPRHWRTPFRRTNDVLISLSTRMSLPRIGKGRERVDFIRMDSIIFPTIIPGRMHSWVSQEGVCINKILCL